MDKVLDMVRAFRAGDASTPIVLMGYYNPIYARGVDRFLAEAVAAGIDGLIVVDLPPEEDAELCIPAQKAGLNFIRLATPTTDDKRLPKVLQNTSGFVYYVSITGITGTKPQPLALPVQLPTVQPDNVTTWVDTARDQQPGVRQAAIALDIARLETKKAETGHLPTLDLQVGYNVTRNPNGTITAPGVNNRTNSASVGVAFNLPLFAGFAVQNRVKETLALEEKASADLETTRRNVAQATRAAFFGVQSGQGQVQALEAAEASSQSALDANKLGYQVGVRINIDVLNAQSQLFQTKRDLAQARYNVLLGTLKLRQAAGTLTQQDIEAINALLIKP